MWGSMRYHLYTREHCNEARAYVLLSIDCVFGLVSELLIVCIYFWIFAVDSLNRRKLGDTKLQKLIECTWSAYLINQILFTVPTTCSRLSTKMVGIGCVIYIFCNYLR